MLLLTQVKLENYCKNVTPNNSSRKSDTSLWFWW